MPLDSHFPSARLSQILEDAAVSVLVTQRSLATGCTTFTGTRIWLDESNLSAGTDAPKVSAAPNQAAYVIYTSGSTGRPKGVVVEHRSVVNLLHDMRSRFRVSERDVLLAVTTVSFDMSVVEIFLPLIAGARMEICLLYTSPSPRD